MEYSFTPYGPEVFGPPSEPSGHAPSKPKTCFGIGGILLAMLLGAILGIAIYSFIKSKSSTSATSAANTTALQQVSNPMEASQEAPAAAAPIKKCIWYTVNGWVNGITDGGTGSAISVPKTALATDILQQTLSQAKSYVLKELNVTKNNCKDIAILWSESQNHFYYGYGSGTSVTEPSEWTTYLLTTAKPDLPTKNVS